MRQRFRPYFPLSPAEYAELWDAGLIVPDANVLLEPYRRSTETAETILHFLEVFAERLRLPHQFALEFARNRSKVVLDHANAYTKAADSLRGVIKELEADRGHPFLPADDIEKLKAVCTRLDEERTLYRRRRDDDQHLGRILTLFDACTGDESSSDTLSAWYEEAKGRYAREHPPGYKDKNKPEPDRYGDFVAWRQIMSLASSEQRPVIVVTQDVKEDWWERVAGETIGPRQELVEEFFRTTGQIFHMYTVDRFVQLAGERTQQQVPQAALRELEEARRQAAIPLKSGAVQAEPVPIDGGDATLGHGLKATQRVIADDAAENEDFGVEDEVKESSNIDVDED